jgi:hypothetical protein
MDRSNSPKRQRMMRMKNICRVLESRQKMPAIAHYSMIRFCPKKRKVVISAQPINPNVFVKLVSHFVEIIGARLRGYS